MNLAKLKLRFYKIIQINQLNPPPFFDIKCITTYKDLYEFIQSQIIQNELKELDLLDNIDNIQLALHNHEDDCAEISTAISKNIGKKIVWKTFIDSSIPDDNNEASISGYYEAEDIDIDFSHLLYYGNGKFGTPFSLKIMVSAIYYIFKSDYYCMDDAPSVTDHNDHYFEAEDDFEVIVTGTVSISIDRDNLNLKNISECIDHKSIYIDDIESIELADK